MHSDCSLYDELSSSRGTSEKYTESGHGRRDFWQKPQIEHDRVHDHPASDAEQSSDDASEVRIPEQHVQFLPAGLRIGRPRESGLVFAVPHVRHAETDRLRHDENDPRRGGARVDADERAHAVAAAQQGHRQ